VRDLLDLLPERSRTTGDLVDAQEDRLSYAVLSPEMQKLPAVERRFAAQALARPAILVGADDKLIDVPQNWSRLLTSHEAEIARVSRATGLIVGGRRH
jgi:hypothetical protein